MSLQKAVYARFRGGGPLDGEPRRLPVLDDGKPVKWFAQPPIGDQPVHLYRRCWEFTNPTGRVEWIYEWIGHGSVPRKEPAT